MSIQFFICFNRQGVLRLGRWFGPVGENLRNQGALNQIVKLVTNRDPHLECNFVALSENTNLVYQRYAGLYFVMGSSASDNELIMLQNIHLFVEVLDAFMGKACELDVIFRFYKAYMIMDEMFSGGELREASRDQILVRLKQLDQLN
ncbi:HFL270Wp [Eremothecium sinecaudum]|uniref:AP complex subunit sigma n=1 Tax=Eremothecium sinecaudum TaxID=45286 RepID=A0A120K2H5_9SACH|nr:HFL270Wp [Eremothecium sinecaudum]AMD21586.1 HFL270Wp [Eremothecium sinecaudum]